jgi:trafficking protein particle complex subunit 9
MLECHGMDVLPFDGAESYDSEEEETTHTRRSLLSIGDDAGWCLFSIDVRNMYGLPFEVTFERDQEGESLSVIPIPLAFDIVSQEHRIFRPHW